MSYIDVTRLGVLGAMIVLAAISGWILRTSLNEGDAGSSWVWAVVFLSTSLIAAWCFWGVA
jgi:hypothetical protein